ncbi:MAG TPA: sulfite exporter TauE/SafE family protein [Gemmatimonadales bacterium]
MALGSALIFLAALLYSSVGHAGASGYLAVMAFLGTAPALMRPTALLLNLLVATIGTVQFARAGYFRWKLFWPFALGSIPAAYLGGRLTLPGSTYKVIVGVVLLLSAIRFFITLRTRDEATRTLSIPVALATGVGLGLLSGLTGVGGGIFLSPLLLLAGWADLRTTAATSVAFILVNSASGLLGQGTAVAAARQVAPAWALAALVGGLLGAWLGSRKLPSAALRGVLGVVLVAAGLKLVLG